MNLTNGDLQQLLQENELKNRELIDRCRNRDRQAFNQFIRKYQDDIFSHAYQMMGNKKAAFDITRDVFVRAYKSFLKFRGETSIDVWLFKIAEQYIHCALRAQKKWYERIFPVSISGQQQETAKPNEYLEQDSKLEELDELLVAYIDGELSDVELEQIEKRLEKDTDYRREYEELQKVDTLLQLFKRTSAPVELRVHINAKIDEGPFWEKVHDVIEIFREATPGRRSIFRPPIIRPLPTRGLEEEKHISQTGEDTQKFDPLREIRRQAEARYDKADFYKKHEKYEKAIQLLLEALQLYQQIEHIEGQILVHHQLALLYKDSGETDKAIHHGQEFLKLYQDLKIVKKYEQIQELLGELATETQRHRD